MPLYTVVLMEGEQETRIGLQQIFSAAVDTERFEQELLLTFNEAGGIPRGNEGWTHFDVYEGLIKRPISADLQPLRTITRDEIKGLQGKYSIRF